MCPGEGTYVMRRLRGAYQQCYSNRNNINPYFSYYIILLSVFLYLCSKLYEYTITKLKNNTAVNAHARFCPKSGSAQNPIKGIIL